MDSKLKTYVNNSKSKNTDTEFKILFKQLGYRSQNIETFAKLLPDYTAVRTLNPTQN